MSFLKNVVQALTPSFLSTGQDNVKIEDDPDSETSPPVLSPAYGGQPDPVQYDATDDSHDRNNQLALPRLPQ